MKKLIVISAALTLTIQAHAGFLDGIIKNKLGDILNNSSKTFTEHVSFKTTDIDECEIKAKTLAEQNAIAKCSSTTGSKCKVLSSNLTDQPHLSHGDFGPVQISSKGSNDNSAEAERSALVNAQTQALSVCMQKTGLQCEIFVQPYITRHAQENPARTIGGLKVPKYDAYATASARPSVAVTNTYECSAEATAKIAKLL